MPTTRKQSRERKSTKDPSTHGKQGNPEDKKAAAKVVQNKNGSEARESETQTFEGATGEKKNVGEKHEVDASEGEKKEEPLTKRRKVEEGVNGQEGDVYKVGVIERGHIHFFYRPRVELESVQSIDDVRNFHMLLVPRPPEFAVAAETADGSTDIKGKPDPEKAEEAEMKTVERGADAVPAPSLTDKEQKYRLITIGKKQIPDPDTSGRGGRKETFWATVTATGDNLAELESLFQEKTYETKTRGTRHQGGARLAGRGVYAFVNAEASKGSQRETHLGYHLSHPPPSEMGEVQEELGIETASSFVIQVKNPLAPSTGPIPTGSKGAEYPSWLMKSVFGASGGEGGEHTKGREEYGLRFASCETPELLDYRYAQLLLVAAGSGEVGLEESLGEGRGEALVNTQDRERKESIDKVFREIGAEAGMFPPEPLEGSWI